MNNRAAPPAYWPANALELNGMFDSIQAALKEIHDNGSNPLVSKQDSWRKAANNALSLCIPILKPNWIQVPFDKSSQRGPFISDASFDLQSLIRNDPEDDREFSGRPFFIDNSGFIQLVPPSRWRPKRTDDQNQQQQVTAQTKELLDRCFNFITDLRNDFDQQQAANAANNTVTLPNANFVLPSTTTTMNNNAVILPNSNNTAATTTSPKNLIMQQIYYDIIASPTHIFLLYN